MRCCGHQGDALSFVEYITFVFYSSAATATDDDDDDNDGNGVRVHTE